MNQYGAIAEKHWRKYLPDRYAQIQDPTAFFNQLGEQIEDQIDELSMTLAGDDSPDDTFMSKLGRLNAAKQMAREKVLAEMLPEPNDELEPTISS